MLAIPANMNECSDQWFFLHYLVLLLFSHYVMRTGYLWNTSLFMEHISLRMFAVVNHISDRSLFMAGGGTEEKRVG
jgi:hypothetical protein